MRSTCLVSVILIIATLPVCAAETGLRYECFRAPVAPTMDGIVSGDPAWAAIPGATGFHKLGGDYTVAKQTLAYATWDDQSLYIAIVAEEPDIARIKPVIRDGGLCWSEDGVELWVQPAGQGPLQFGVTCGGARCTGEGGLGLQGWEAKASQTADTYSLEVRFAFRYLGLTPSAGDVWHTNFCRNIYTRDSGGDQYTTWAPLVARFLEPERFPQMVFEARVLTPEAAREVEGRLNASYRAQLLSGLETLGAEASEFLPVLAEAAADPRYREAALPLKAAWEEAAALQREAAGAGLSQVRRVLARADRLRLDSYNLKYRVLIDRLFE